MGAFATIFYSLFEKIEIRYTNQVLEIKLTDEDVAEIVKAVISKIFKFEDVSVI